MADKVHAHVDQAPASRAQHSKGTDLTCAFVEGVQPGSCLFLGL